MGIMPKQTKAENKIKWGFTYKRVIGLMMTIGLASSLSSYVHKFLLIPFIIFCVAVFLFTQMKAPTNPKKIFIFGLRDYFFFLLAPKKYNGVNNNDYKQAIKLEEEKNEKKKKKAKNTSKK